jgi:hypothetical protein
MPHMSDTCASNPCRPPEDDRKSLLSIEADALSHQRGFFHTIRLSNGRHAGSAASTPNPQVPEGFFGTEPTGRLPGKMNIGMRQRLGKQMGVHTGIGQCATIKGHGR